MRIAIGIEYDGTHYNGWQRQRVGDGVQAVVETAIGSVADETVEVVCAGRTDTGVHASGQVGHFDTRAERSERGWLLGVNSELPDDVSIQWVHPVPDEFHARFSALDRSYRYRILNRLVRPALERHRCWWVYTPLAADAMHEAGQALLGEHDFSAFRAAGCQAKSSKRELQSLVVTRQGDWIDVHVRANAFLQHMVRNLAGTLVEIGSGKQAIGWAREVLDSRDRKAGGPTAPPQGLTLTHVTYPDKFGLPARDTGLHRVR